MRNLIFGSQAAGLSLDINMGGKCKVTLSPILTEEFKRKDRNKLLPSKQILKGLSNSSQSAQHLWALTCAHTHTHPKSQYIKQHTFFFIFYFCFLFFINRSISLIISLPLLTITFLQRFSHVFPYKPCPFFGPNPCISMTVQILKYLP